MGSIRESSDRLLNITGELLNMTQVESGKLRLMPKVVKPVELIDYAVKATQVYTMFRQTSPLKTWWR